MHEDKRALEQVVHASVALASHPHADYILAPKVQIRVPQLIRARKLGECALEQLIPLLGRRRDPAAGGQILPPYLEAVRLAMQLLLESKLLVR